MKSRIFVITMILIIMSIIALLFLNHPPQHATIAECVDTENTKNSDIESIIIDNRKKETSLASETEHMPSDVSKYVLLDLASLSNEERQLSINIAFEELKENIELAKNYVTVVFTEDIMFVTFDLTLLRKAEVRYPGDDYIICVRINRKTGEAIP